MSSTIKVPCRVDYRAIGTGFAVERASRLGSLSATGCTIRTGQPPDGASLELRIYLPDGGWPIRIDHVQVSWGHWDEFTVTFVDMPASDLRRLQEYLSAEPVLQED